MKKNECRKSRASVPLRGLLKRMKSATFGIDGLSILGDGPLIFFKNHHLLLFFKFQFFLIGISEGLPFSTYVNEVTLCKCFRGY